MQGKHIIPLLLEKSLLEQLSFFFYTVVAEKFQSEKLSGIECV